MKILYIAFACDPFKGSESQCGWNWVLHMRNYANVYLLTRKENKKNIEKYIADNIIKNITIFYYDIPEFINMYYKFQKMYHFYYTLWLKLSYKYIKKLHQKYNFDYIHHVTLGDFRFMSRAWQLKTNFLFGPVGGAQVTPAVFKPYTKRENMKEKMREFINNIVLTTPNYKKGLKKSKYIFCANNETKSIIERNINNKNKCILLSENGIQKNSIAKCFSRDNKVINLLWAGRMVNRKGIDFLLDIVPLINTERKFKILLVGDGPKKQYYEKKVKSRNISDKVKFLGKISFEEMKKIYSSSHIFVFPSLRETMGTVIFEAMSNGLPVVTFNQNGASIIIEEETGIKIDIDSDLKTIKENFAKALTDLIEDDEKREAYGKNSIVLMKEKYTWENKVSNFYNKYLKEVKK